MLFLGCCFIFVDVRCLVFVACRFGVWCFGACALLMLFVYCFVFLVFLIVVSVWFIAYGFLVSGCWLFVVCCCLLVVWLLFLVC